MSDLFDRARQSRKLEDYAGQLVKLRKSGSNEFRGPCPLCRSGSTLFKVDVARQAWFCFGCERHGDVVDLHKQIHHFASEAEAARDLAGPAPRQAEAVKPREPFDDAERLARIAKIAGAMVSASRPIAGTLGERYLIGRGIEAALVERLDGPRFHDAAPHSWNEEARVWRTAPAIVCRVVTPGGWPGGVHATYLDAAGGKASLDPAKRMWGPQGEETPAGKRRGGSWLIGGFPEGGDLVVGEGLETSLSLASHLWRKGWRDFGVAAALSLGALQGGLRRDEQGCVDIWAPGGDPASPAFTWPPCNTADQPRPRVALAVDLDMKMQTVKARTGRGKPRDYKLDSRDRGIICAKLASAAWRAAGWTARPFYPAGGVDWNDQVKA